MSMRIWSIPIFALILGGCNGEIRTKIWTADSLHAAASSDNGIPGVFGYYLISVVEVDRLTTLVDKDNKLVAENCAPVKVQKLVQIADTDHPVQVWYNYGFLEANKFNVTLTNSVITGVNSESAPDQGKTILNVSEAAGNLAKIAAPVPALPPGAAEFKFECNSGLTFDHYEKFKIP